MRLDGLARRYPNINFIMAHMGYPYYVNAWSVAHANLNVYLDTSGGGVWQTGAPAVYNALSRFIPIDFYRKVIWGSDNCGTPKENMENSRRNIEEMGCPKDAESAVFGETAVRLLYGEPGKSR